MSKIFNMLKTVKCATIDGEITLISSSPLKLGGIYRVKTGTIPFEIFTPPKAKLKEATLEIAVTSTVEPINVKWRVWFNGFPLTREFKPQTSIEIKGEYFSKILFDVAPILLARKQEEASLTIKYEGAEEIIIDHANLILAYHSSEAKSSYRYYSGALVIPPNEDFTFKVPLNIIDEKSGEIRAISIIPSKHSRMIMRLNGEKIAGLENISGTEEIFVDNVHVKEENIVNVKYEHIHESYAKAPLKLSTFILASTKILKPYIKVKEIKIFREHDQVKISAKIGNVGETIPDKSWLLLIDTGIIVNRMPLPELKPEEEIMVEVPLKTALRMKQHMLSLRTVWTKLSRTFTDEVRFKEKITLHS